MMSRGPLTPEQQKMDSIFENYFEVSDLLSADVSALLDSRNDDDPVWRRAFIRAIVPLIEGFAYSFLSICYANPDLTSDERQKVDPDRRAVTSVRIKAALKSIFGQIDISPAPDFSGQDWANARSLFKARDALMHPKTPRVRTY